MTEQRYTDRDVALILRRAVELDQAAGQEPAGRGLTVGELEEIAVEVGIDPAMVRRAALELAGRTSLPSGTIWGAPVVARQVRAVPTSLSEPTLRKLISTVDREVRAQGSVSEALGTVRWNSSGRFLQHQVSLEPGEGETLIRVEERYEERVKGMLHGIPAAYGGGLGFVLGVESIAGGGPLVGLVLGVVGGLGAMAMGRQVWNWLSSRSRGRVKALADSLAAEASGVSRPAIGEGEYPPSESGEGVPPSA